MATTITKVVPLFDFNEACYFLTYSPEIGPPNDLASASGIGSYSISNTDSVNGNISYTKPSMRIGNDNYTTYDNTIGAYHTKLTEDNQPISTSNVVIATPGVNSTGFGTITVNLTGQDPYKINYVYDQNGWNATDKPQGLLLATGECQNGLVRVFAQSEAKLGDNYDATLTGNLQLWNTDTNTLYTSGSVATIIASTKAKIWDLGFISPNTVLNLRVIGANSQTGSSTPLGVDFINKSITVPSCPVPSAQATNDVVGNKPVNTPQTLDVSPNDTVCSLGGVRTYAFASGTATNAINISNTGTVFTYTVPATGAFSFTYNLLCDGVITATAQVSGTGVSTLVDAIDNTEVTNVNVAKTINFGANDILCDGATTSWQIVNPPANGSLSSVSTSTGSALYTPNANFVGADSFTYNILCNAVVMDTATVSVNVVENSKIELVKTISGYIGNASNANAGDVIQYSFSVKNAGLNTLNNVTVTDTNATVVGSPIILTAGQVNSTAFTATHVVTLADITAGIVNNIANVTSTSVTGATITNKSYTSSVLAANSPIIGGPGVPTSQVLIAAGVTCLKNIVVDSQCATLTGCTVRLTSAPTEINRVDSVTGKNIKFTCRSTASDYTLTFADGQSFQLTNQSC
jgi:hypothetical protein